MIRGSKNATGVTFIELMATLAILSILAMGILPLTKMTYTRIKEMELRSDLRMIRKALDEYKKLADEKKIQIPYNSSGYPESLEILVQGVEVNDGSKTTKKKFLRRIPVDPMTEDGKWGLRSYSDEPDSESWGGQDVYDVYTKTEKKAIDGSDYRKW